MNDFIENMNEMTFDELKTVCEIVSELYLKHTENATKFYGIDEYFRTQIDVIEHHCIKKFGRSTFIDNIQ